MQNIKKAVVKEIPFSKSKVDIIIPFYAQYEKVVSLIQSIVLAVRSNPYQITLIDDCSENENFSKETFSIFPVH